jgi:dephospho-CoA kinase
MVIGITGGFCTGKSKVEGLFKKFGAKIIDLDKLAHAALSPGTNCFKKIIKEFGNDILVNKYIDRPLLARKVFGNKKQLARLNSIIHPIVIKEMANIIKRHKHKLIVVEAPLLFEAGLKKYFDYIVVVKANQENQISRAIRKTGLDRRDVLKRINSQWPIGKKVQMADFVIDNNNSFGKTAKQVNVFWNNLRKNLKFS